MKGFQQLLTTQLEKQFTDAQKEWEKRVEGKNESGENQDQRPDDLKMTP